MTTIPAEPTRRDFLYIATGAMGAVGAAAVAVPLISQMNPDASTIAAGAPVEVDIGQIPEGQVIKVFWRGKPIFIAHRTKKEIDEARNVRASTTATSAPATARNTTPPAVSAGAQRRQIFRCRLTSSCPIPRSGSADRPVQEAHLRTFSRFPT